MKTLILATLIICSTSTTYSFDQTSLSEFNSKVKPFLEKYCYSCHDEDTQKGKFAIHNIDGKITNGQDVTRWVKTLEMVTLEEMPPQDKKKQPTESERIKLIQWVEAELKKIGKGPDEQVMRMPENGNRVKHRDLFSGKNVQPAYSPARIWRINPYIYDEFIKRFRSLLNGASKREISQPFAEMNGHGIKDYDLLTANEGTLKVLMQTSYRLAGFMVLGIPSSTGKRKGKSKDAPKIKYGRPKQIKSFVNLNKFALAKGEPSEEEFKRILDSIFNELLQRSPSAHDQSKYTPLLKRNIAQGGRAEGLRYTIMAIMMSPEFIFRMEHGWGKQAADGRRMLSERELLYSIAYTLSDKAPDAELQKAMIEGKLKTRGDIEREVRRMLNSPSGEDFWGYLGKTGSKDFNPRFNIKLLRFFREFFGYTHAGDVFKDDERNQEHEAKRLIKDADLLVLDALKKDRDVLKTLLTTDKYFVAYTVEKSALSTINRMKTEKPKKKKKDDYAAEQFKNNKLPIPDRAQRRYISSYNLAKDWSYQVKQPFALPKNERAGMLTHPAWLVAHSGNFENDPVRRGKWITERLLAGIVPDVPIGVDAKVPEDHSKTLRERFQLVNKEECWRCHKKMNPLGDVFEAYDDFGRYREMEPLIDPAEFAKKLKEYEHKAKRKALRDKLVKPVLPQKPVNKTTVITNSGDPSIDGTYKDAIELVHKLADSQLVRQSFIRHIFRYFMGRNETLRDSQTLIAMDKAYVRSGGSFKEALVALITSDSFIYRK